MISRIFIFACLFLSSFASARKNYEGYKLIQVTPESAEHVAELNKLTDLVDFWTPPRLKRPTDILIPPKFLNRIDVVLTKLGLTWKTMNENIQKAIDHEMVDNEAEIMRRVSNLHIDEPLDVIGIWARNAQIMTWMDSIASQYKDIASTRSIGKSYEGRDLKIIKLGSAGSNKPSFWIDCTVHAREWLSVASCNWMIKELLSGYSTNPRIKALLDKYDWWWMPVANPDGYEFSHTGDRMWRKTRTPTKDFDVWGNRCMGVDPNRNYDSYWSSGIGTSDNGCSNTYKGPTPFSERNTKAMADFITSQASNLKMFIAIHTYSEMWLTPWGYTHQVRPSDAAELDRVADIAVKALYDVHGTLYYRGTPGQLLYDASGGSFDWAKEKAGIKYSYALELRPDYECLINPNCNGFIVTRDQIVPTAQETFASFIAAAEALPY